LAATPDAGRRGAALAHAADVRNKDTGAWLAVAPLVVVGNDIDAPAFRMALALRAGLDAGGGTLECPRCAREWPADGRHLVGCAGSRGTRHNAVRDIAAGSLRASGVPVLTETTVADALAMAGVSGPGPPGPPPSPASVGAPGAPAAACPPRPCDILYKHRIRSDAPSGVSALDVTIVVPDSVAALSGGPGGAGAAREARALDLAFQRKMREQPPMPGVVLRPFCITTNGTYHDGAVKVLKEVALVASVKRRQPFSVVVAQLRERIAVATQRANGDILARARRWDDAGGGGADPGRPPGGGGGAADGDDPG
jgi:hypothetical protein